MRSRRQEEEGGEEGKVVAVDLGASKLRIGVFEKGLLRNLLIFKTPKGVSSEEFPLKLAEYIKVAVGNERDIVGIGIASIGPLDIRTGEVIGAPNIDPHSFKLRDPLGEIFGTKIAMVNDCVAAVWGEYVMGGWNNYSDQAYVTLSTGIGVGVIIERKLLLGRRGNAHELGHSVIDFDSKILCGCGGKGHWEALAGGSNLSRTSKMLSEVWKGPRSKAFDLARKGQLSPPEIFSYARRGDVFAKEVVSFIGKAIAAGLANVIAAYDPEVIHLGGSIYLNNEDLLLTLIKNYIKEYSVLEPPLLRRTTFGSLTPLFGAASLIYKTPENLEKYLYVP